MKVAFLTAGGIAPCLTSSIISLIKSPQILRLGGLEVKKIEKVLKKKIKINVNPLKKIAPGQSKLHYSPGIPVRLNITKPKRNEAYILINKRNKKSNHFYYISKNKNLNEAAKNLYSCLRKIKNKGYKSIAVEKIPNKNLGSSINDRLNRASKF